MLGVSAGLAGCSALSGDGTDSPAPTESTETDEDDDRSPSERQVEALWEKLQSEAAPPEGKVTVAFGFLEQVPIKTEVYMPASDANLWDMKTYDTTDLSEVDLLGQPPKRLPTVETDDMRAFYAHMEPGQQAQVGLTVTNDRDTVQFIAGPPDLEPYGLYEGLIANCYCNGLTYTVPGDGTWVRVIRAKLRDAVEPGGVGLAVWPLVPGDAETDGGDSGEFDGWFDNVSNYEGVVDETGQEEVSVTVGAPGNDGNFAFDPAAIRVSTGTTVVWEWEDTGGSHNVVANDGSFRSGDPVSGAETTFAYTFEESGTYEYYCSPHKNLGMKGAVVVE